MEVWKSIKGYEGLYEVSNLGNVQSLNYNKTKQTKKLKPLFCKEYHRVCLYNDIGKTHKSIHVIVAETFLNHTSCGMQLVVNHINFNKIDNRVENLEIVTNRENTNKKHLKSSSQYIGVSLHKSSKKWQSNIFFKGKLKYLGLFDNEIDAHNEYQKALNNL